MPGPCCSRPARAPGRRCSRSRACCKNLTQLKTPVNIVMISEGMFVARDRQNMATLGRLAAEARATIHVIRPSQNFFDVEERAPGGSSRFFDDGLMSEGLEQVAGQTRGSMSTVNGDGKIAFDRLGRELSGYYLLGFEPTEADRTGRERRIKVEVKTARPDGTRAADVRGARGRRPTAKTELTPMQQLGEVLKSPLPVRGLPMRVATYTAIESGSAKVRVVITAEVGDPATTPRGLAGRRHRPRQERQDCRQSRRRVDAGAGEQGR